jgi:NADH:ubiquinone oxidoreductase subunit 5 (subunit L)/multisubunit Na+/H+ antiporter MnhA subunit
VSYLLIGFWYTRIEANKASLKALIVNRVGDLCLLFATCICLWVFRTCDFHLIYAMCPYIVDEYVNFFGTIKLINLISILFFIAIIGKSAQLILHL